MLTARSLSTIHFTGHVLHARVDRDTISSLMDLCHLKKKVELETKY